MSSLTCIIDYQGDSIKNCKLNKANVLLTENKIIISASSDYNGKYLFIYSDSKLLLLIGSAFLKNESIGLIKNKSQLQKLRILLEQGKKPESILTGFYNLIMVDISKHQSIIHNSHFGMRPLFYSLFDESCVISTNPESIIKTGLIEGKIQLSTALQFFLFNYPVNEDTIFKNVYSLPNGCRMIFTEKGSKFEYYFDADSLITRPIYNYKESIQVIHESIENVLIKYSKDISSFSLSLTGGWDSRLLLSLLNNFNVTVNTYSHGSPLNPDITIPQFISKKLGINYTPYILDDAFNKTQFFEFAKRTVDMSSGIRSVTRAHYLFSIGSEMQRNNYIITGIGGSNLMKGGSNTPMSVINAQVLKLIYEPNFEKFWDHIENFFNERIDPTIKVAKEDLEYLKKLLSEVHSKYQLTPSLEKRLYRFTLNITERKYFGAEIMTYSNFGENLSPFIDIEFLDALSKTPYFGAYMPIGKGKNLFTNWRNSLLYAKIINTSYPELGKIASDKGVSLYDLSKIYRWPWVANQQIKKRLMNEKKQHYDHDFVLDKLTFLIQDFPLIKNEGEFLIKQKKVELINNMISFIFWANSRRNYL